MAATTTRKAEAGDGETAAAAEDRRSPGGGGDGSDGAAAAAASAALLIVIGELQSGDERDLALQRVVDGKQMHFKNEFQRRQLLNGIKSISFLFYFISHQ